MTKQPYKDTLESAVNYRGWKEIDTRLIKNGLDLRDWYQTSVWQGIEDGMWLFLNNAIKVNIYFPIDTLIESLFDSYAP